MFICMYNKETDKATLDLTLFCNNLVNCALSNT